MAQEYTITKVSQDEPRTWDGPKGTIYFHKVMLSGHEKPVSIGKKTADKLNVNGTVYGTIEQTDYDTDKFHPAAPQNGAPRAPRDDSAIQAQWAIGQSVQIALVNIGKTTDMESFNEYVEQQAKYLFEMIGRVKGGNS